MMLDGYGAAAAAARLCRVRLGIGNSELINSLRTPEHACELLDLSGTAALSAALAASASSQRVLLHADVSLKPFALARLPALSVSSEPANWALCFTPCSAQEIIDDLIIAYILSEQRGILLPSRIVIDQLAQQTGLQVELPAQKSVDRLLKPFNLGKPERHLRQTTTELDIHKAMDRTAKALDKLKQTWRSCFGRRIGAVGYFRLDGANFVFVCHGYISQNAKLAVAALRSAGEPVGLVRLRVLRPWPEAQLQQLLDGIPRAAVLDSQISAGTWPKLYQGIKTWYNGIASAYIYKHLSVNDIITIYKRASQTSKPELVWC